MDEMEFLPWAQNFSAYFTAHATNMGFTAMDAGNITAVVEGYDGALEDGGKNAHYILIWVAKDGSKGTWSETLTATIVG